MAYIKTSWVARVGTALNRFLKTNESAGSVELTNDPTGVTTAGTPFTVANMNKIEQGIYDAHVVLDDNINQNVKTTASPTFASINTGQGATEVYLMNQNLRKTDNVSFANINPPADNNDASMPSVGIGGFSYAVGLTGIEGAFPSISIGSGGTWVYIASSGKVNTSDYEIRMYKVAGGSSIQGLIAASNVDAYLYVIAWRIA